MFSETLFSLVETFCSRVNDEYCLVAMQQFEENSFDREKVMSLPGVDAATRLSNDMLQVCGRGLLQMHCPAALELLVWVNSPEKLQVLKKKSLSAEETLLLTQNPKSDAEKEVLLKGEHTELAALDEKDEPSIEMLAPKRSSELNSTPSEIDLDIYGPPIKQLLSAEDSVRSNGSFMDYRETGGSKSNLQQMISGHDERVARKRELAWVLGLHRQERENRVKYLWQPRMMISTTLFKDEQSDDNAGAPVTSMNTNKSESILVAGNSRGEVILFDLRCQPPSLKCRHQFVNHHDSKGEHQSIKQVDFFDREDALLVCNGGLHLWDTETQKNISSLSKKNAFTDSHGSWRGDDFVGFSVFPKGTSTGEIFHGSYGEIAAISSSYLYIIDVRCRNSVGDNGNLLQPARNSNSKVSHFDPMFRTLTWYTETVPGEQYDKTSKSNRQRDGTKSEPPSFNLTCLTTHCGGGDWICVGSSSGHIHCFDRRQGKLLACWKAHMKSVEYLKAVSRHRLLSVSGDKTAVLWDLTQTPPQKISRIYSKWYIITKNIFHCCAIVIVALTTNIYYGSFPTIDIPGKEFTMNVTSHQFRNDGLVSIPGGDFLVCAASGRKAVFQPMPQITSDYPENGQMMDVKADRIVMSDFEGSRISSSGKFNISSIVLLPCRQLVLLGCDGEIHVCL